MKSLFLILAVTFGTSASAMEPPAELKLIAKAAEACYEGTAKALIESVVGQDVRHRSEMDMELGQITNRSYVDGVNTRCFGHVTFTHYFLASFTSCDLSEDMDYVTLSLGTECRLPTIRFETQEVNDGYDRVGNPVNRRKVLKKAWLDQGTCADKTIALKNSSTRQPTPFSVNFKSVLDCLKEVSLPASP